jgi:hypothetical protein
VISFVKSVISFNIVNVYEDVRATHSKNCTLHQLGFNSVINNAKSLWERTSNLDLSNTWYNHFSDVISTVDMNTYGFSVKLIFGKVVLCYRSIDKGQKITVTTHLTVFFARKKKFFEKLEAEIRRHVVLEKEKAMSYQSSEYVNVWLMNSGSILQKFKRGIDTVFTNDNIHVKLLESLKTFINNRDMYKSLSYPYSFSALMHGEPGCGKTSTLFAIASELGYNLTYVDVSKSSVADIVERTNSSNREILVFEDVDAVGITTESNRDNDRSIRSFSRANDKTGLSLSDLLNLTDGLLSTEGSIFIFTTNHIDKLDKALLRKGRMNEVIEFKLLNGTTASKMIEHHLGVKLDGLTDNIKPTELQDAILEIKLGTSTIEGLKAKFSR